jgi:Kef-type K+ transport system membrane component KefB
VSKEQLLFHLLLAMAVVVVASRLLGAVCRFLAQPAVIGEVAAGILLGPSLLGWLWPSARAFLLPAPVEPLLWVVAQLGVILYMFLVGLEFNTGILRERGHTTVAVSLAGMVLPFVIGLALAVWLYPVHGPSGVSFLVFALFLGVSLSVTAFPVLARILTDRKMSRTRLGALSLACAAVGDVAAWCLLAFVVGVAQAKVGGALVTAALTAGYVALMWFVVRPLMLRLVPGLGREGGPTQGSVAALFVAVLVSALTTEWIGIHAIFGAFLLGAVVPHDSAVARDTVQRLEDTVSVLLLPAFFAYTGLRTQIGLLGTLDAWLVCGAIVAAATTGKFLGSAVAARLTGLGWRDAASVGVLMNTRGLMELIVLNIGLDLGVIGPTLFAMLVVMALVTTAATTPVLDALTRRQTEDSSREAAEPQATPSGEQVVHSNG